MQQLFYRSLLIQYREHINRIANICLQLYVVKIHFLEKIFNMVILFYQKKSCFVDIYVINKSTNYLFKSKNYL